jgi:hypothetical protein
LMPLDLTSQKVKVQAAREEAHVPGEDKRRSLPIYPTELVTDGGEIVVGL